MDFEYHDDGDDRESPGNGGSHKTEITWLTIALWAAAFALVAAAIYFTRDMPLVPPA